MGFNTIKNLVELVSNSDILVLEVSSLFSGIKIKNSLYKSSKEIFSEDCIGDYTGISMISELLFGVEVDELRNP